MRGGFIEYQQFICFRVKIRKIHVYPCTPEFYNIKLVFQGVCISLIWYPDELSIFRTLSPPKTQTGNS